MTDMYASAKELSRFVDKVLKTTGATKVDIVGHSEGPVLSRLYFKYLDGVAKTGTRFVTPYTSGFLKTAGPNVFNTKLQSLCPYDFSGHLEQLHDRK
ncbi:hypothetical protein BGX21_003205 [Mortierella sp. AD011]|nr:hypothetical protein BGX20_003272 [Mortierella sp. AD010]KAF9400910.1 hypothetical protein BGX21_003205 [Mortierella sp. AD011]